MIWGVVVSVLCVTVQHCVSLDLARDERNAHSSCVTSVRRDDTLQGPDTPDGPSDGQSPLLNYDPSQGQYRKRARNSWNAWTLPIDYIIDSTYPDLSKRFMLWRSLEFLHYWTCLRFVDRTYNFTSRSTPYITYYDDFVGCNTYGGGMPSGNKTLKVSPCSDSKSNVHETYHAMGGAHMQQSYSSRNYMSLQPEDIRPDRLYTYDDSNPAVDGAFDFTSTMTYVQEAWSATGQETYHYLQPQVGLSDGSVCTEYYLLNELNNWYSCASSSCSDYVDDCSPGYLALIGDTCQCACPPGLDPATKCKNLYTQADTSLAWPKPVAFISGASDFSCPPYFQRATLYFCGLFGTYQWPQASIKFPTSGKAWYMPICERNSTSGGPEGKWPVGGRFCYIKSIGCDCSLNEGFNEAQMAFNSTCTPGYSGNSADIRVDTYTNKVTMKLCCRSSDYHYRPISLPNSVGFQLFYTSSLCPFVYGMREFKNSWDLYVNRAEVTTTGFSNPSFYYFDSSNDTQFSLCHYIAPVYGKSQVINLSCLAQSVTISSTGFGGPRPPNTRDQWFITGPANSVMIVYINDFSVDVDDKLLLKTSGLHNDAFRMDNNNPYYQFETHKNFTHIEFWSGWKNSSATGVRITVTLVCASDSCYDVTTKGVNYQGDVNIAETGERCLHWTEEIGCYGSSYTVQDHLIGKYEGSSCRNGGDRPLLKPKCPVYRNGSNCIYRYCDACNKMTIVDFLGSAICTNLINADPTFCTTNEGRTGCFKSCNFTRGNPSPSGSCGAPSVPSDGVLVDAPKSSYKVGDRVSIRCRNNNTDNPFAMMCTKSGWSSLTSACSSSTADRSNKCQTALAENAFFCADTEARRWCPASCGINSGTPQCSTPSSPTYSRTDGNTTVKAGAVMNFTCNPGYFLTGGNTSRACGINGQLLGTAPVCESSPAYLDVGKDLHRGRKLKVAAKVFFLIDTDGYRVPIDGRITTVYYYCFIQGAQFYFVVFRNTGSSYTFVGSILITCTANWKMSYAVPAANQITVKAGDLYGAYSPTAGVLAMNDGTSALTKLLNTPTATVDTLSQMQATTTFPTTKNFIPALACRVSK